MEDSKKKILIIANSDIGLYKFRLELIEKLLESNDVYIALPSGDFIGNLVDIGCKFEETRINRRGTNPLTDIKLLIKYIRMIKGIKPDIILTYTIKPNIYGGIASRIMGIPYISTITGLGSSVEKKGLMHKLIVSLYKKALQKATAVFFQNKPNADFFADKNIYKGYTEIVSGSGVNLEKFKLSDYPSSECIEFVFISRIMKEKGIEYYLKVAKYISEKYTNTRFHVLGFCEESEYEEKLKEYQMLGIIQYHGMQSDVRKYLEKAHCIVHPTYYPEGMSNVLLEAAAIGRPIITTNRSGCKEIVDHGMNGYLVDQHNTNELISTVEEFINLPSKDKRDMGLNSRKKVENEFDRSIVVNTYMNKINSIIKR